jgi:hypothetical protein
MHAPDTSMSNEPSNVPSNVPSNEPSNESNNRYVSSRGILKSCDYVSLTPISSIRRLINYPDLSILANHPCPVIYVCGSAIPHFATTLINMFSGPFVLVTGDCDETVHQDIFKSHTDFESFISNPRLVRWYSQNAITQHQKLTQIPIGLDYHTMVTRPLWGNSTISTDQQELELVRIVERSPPRRNRFIKCYANFQFTTNTKYGYDRLDALNRIPGPAVYYEKNPVDRRDTWINQSAYAFVISPHGGGYDCHRTWEALVLGCIPVVKASGLDPLYADLPVLIVYDWADVTPELLQKTILRFSDMQFNFNKLSLSYWIDTIRSNRPPSTALHHRHST